MAVAHTPRADESHVYGSVHFDAGADVLVRLLTDRRDDLVGAGLEITKANDISPQSTMIMAYEFDQNGLTGVRKASAKDFPTPLAGKKLTQAEQLLDFVLEIGIATATEAAKETGINRSTCSRLFSNDDRFTFVNKVGAKAYYGAKH